MWECLRLKLSLCLLCVKLCELCVKFIFYHQGHKENNSQRTQRLNSDTYKIYPLKPFEIKHVVIKKE